MKVLMINSVCGIRSTGRICTDIAEELEKQGHDVKIAYGRETVPEKYQKYAVRIGTELDVKLHGIKTRLFDRHGFGSKRVTKKFIKWVEEYDPDVIHLHNLHGYYINIKILFDYLKKANKKVVWTLHDCWAFTGHCTHFDYNQCDQWINGCKSCRFHKEYPKSYLSAVRRNYLEKKKLFNSLTDVKYIVPSDWMKSVFSMSYLSQYEIDVLPNGIDLTKFHRVNSNIKTRYAIEDKKIILGVASIWLETKGITYINKLSEDLDDKEYVIVVIGNISDDVAVSEKIIKVSETSSIDELCEWYSCARVFINPTLQESQGLTTIEALACGTPAVVFNSGGAAECLDEECGAVAARGDYDRFLKSVVSLCETSYNVDPAKVKKYDKELFSKKYVDLYNGCL